MDFMVSFFAQSGYSIAFLHFIMAAEIIGGVALILPWLGLAQLAAAGLAVDMVGAIVTHVQNGDPLDDSTGAIGMLIRLGTIAALSVSLGRRPKARHVGAIVAVAVLGAALAIAGARGLRDGAPEVKTAGPFGPLVGVWHCAGTFASSGKPIESDLHVELDLEGWLMFRHDDRPPNRYHALAEWRETTSGMVATIQDSFGGLRLFRSPGWRGKELVWEGGDLAAERATQRFTYEDRTPVELGIRYQNLRDSVWQLVDSVTCTRAR
jgi:hypothetical protein